MGQGRIAEGQQVTRQMIQLYYGKKEENETLYDSCRGLFECIIRRLDRCRYGVAKPTCRKCPIHCYRPDTEARIQVVMRWAGPRMLSHHPLAALKHLLREL